MAKTMARIENGVVVNIEWYADKAPETDFLKNANDRRLAAGDTFDNGKFYRNGTEVLTPLEEAQKMIEEKEATIADMQTALETLGVIVDG